MNDTESRHELINPLGPESGSPGVDITAVTKLKHADLWAAAKKLGSQAALARHLGIQPYELCCWINLRRCPPPEPTGSRWTEEYLAEMEGKLLALTGKPWEELFPRDLRDNAEFLDSRKTIEKTARLRSVAMSQYALATRERLKRIEHNTEECRHEETHKALLEAMEVLNDRQREVLKMRFGIGQPDGVPRTLPEIAKMFSITKERVRQLECRALQKLQEARLPTALHDAVEEA